MAAISFCMNAHGMFEPVRRHFSPLGQYTSEPTPCCFILSREHVKQNLCSLTEGHWTKCTSSNCSLHRVHLRTSGLIRVALPRVGAACGLDRQSLWFVAWNRIPSSPTVEPTNKHRTLYQFSLKKVVGFRHPNSKHNFKLIFTIHIFVNSIFHVHWPVDLLLWHGQCQLGSVATQ